MFIKWFLVSMEKQKGGNMKYRSLKNQPTRQSLLGFGCMRFPLVQGTQEIDEEKAMEMIDYAYQNGVNYFDTAYIYHEGKSENFIGRALKKYPRESFYLADKMPGWVGIKSKADAQRIFKEQLERCQVEYFDFYLLHSLSKWKDYEDVYLKAGAKEYLLEEKKQGRIRYLGFSFHGDEELLKRILAEDSSWDFIQLQINYLDWNMQNAAAFYRLLEKYDIPCIVMEPVRGGSLIHLDESSIALMKETAPDKSIAAWALEFVADLPLVVTILSGMSTMEHVKDNIQTLSDFQGLTEKEYAVIETVVENYMKKGLIPCTACRYCMDCSFGVDIPAVFAIYNRAARNNDLPIVHHNKRGHRGDRFLREYRELTEAHQAHHCVACRKCEKLCPQNIRIADRMFEIKQLVSLAESIPN